MSALIRATMSLIQVLEKDYDDFKIIWSVFVPECNIQQKKVHDFLDVLHVWAKHYLIFVKILLIYHDKYPIKDGLLLDMYNEAIKVTQTQDFTMFDCASMKQLYAKEVKAVEDAFAAREEKRLADIRKAFGEKASVDTVSRQEFNQLKERLDTLELKYQDMRQLILHLDASVALLRRQ